MEGGSQGGVAEVASSVHNRDLSSQAVCFDKARKFPICRSVSRLNPKHKDVLFLPGFYKHVLVPTTQRCKAARFTRNNAKCMDSRLLAQNSLCENSGKSERHTEHDVFVAVTCDCLRSHWNMTNCLCSHTHCARKAPTNYAPRQISLKLATVRITAGRPKSSPCWVN